MSDEELPVYTRNNRPLPFRESPIRFAVTMKNGLTSNVWGVRVEGTGDAYIYCRDNMKEVKISLHRSGKQHIAFTKGSGHETKPSSRFWNQWREPLLQRPPVPTFKLVFPGWATSLNEKDRKKVRAKWDTNQVLIEGDDELLTVVSFFILDEGLVPWQEGLPSVPIGILSLRPGKDLCVIASHEYERNFKSVVETGLKRIRVNTLLPGEVCNRVLSVCLTGDEPAGYAYMVVVPVEIIKERQT